MSDFIKYIINTATTANIASHLKNCEKSFLLDLETRVDINEYSKKIKENAVLFEAWVGGRLTGLLAAYFNRIEGKTAYITNVSVLEKYQKMGIASMLMMHCIEYGIAGNFEIIRLEVSANNINALRFYSKFDFQTTGHKNDYLVLELNINKTWKEITTKN